MIHDVYYELLKFLKVSKIHLLFSLHYAVYTCGGNIHLQIMIKHRLTSTDRPPRPTSEGRGAAVLVQTFPCD